MQSVRANTQMQKTPSEGAQGVASAASSSFSFEALQQAARSRQPDASYAGDISCEEAWQLLSSMPAAQLVDVRTQPEWVFAGVPNLSVCDKKAHLISWAMYPDMQPNAEFISAVHMHVPSKDTPIVFLCRTGGRSKMAAIAATQAGYRAAFNILDGFDGGMNEAGQRGTIGGWRAQGLAWSQQ